MKVLQLSERLENTMLLTSLESVMTNIKESNLNVSQAVRNFEYIAELVDCGFYYQKVLVSFFLDSRHDFSCCHGLQHFIYLRMFHTLCTKHDRDTQILHSIDSTAGLSVPHGWHSGKAG